MIIRRGRENRWEALAQQYNGDSYNRGVIEWAEEFAEACESAISNGVALSECYVAAHDAAYDKIKASGFMVDTAIEILKEVWVYGEAIESAKRIADQGTNDWQAQMLRQFRGNR